MKLLLVLSFTLLAAFSLCAQPEFARADSIAGTFNKKYNDATELALQLTKPFDTDREKARVIFSWIAYNIRYDYKKYKDPPPKPRIGGRTPQELQKNIQAFQEDEIRNTLRHEKGVCADYSRLFQKMCTAAGLESVVISGISRKMSGRGGSHAWNAVKIGEDWRLVDATWGAGFVDDDTERFVQRFTPAFFFTSPSLFLLNHLPDDEKWQLLEKPVSKVEFNEQPMVNFTIEAFPLEAFSPENGKIVPTDGKAEIRLKFSTIPTVFVVAAGKKREIQSDLKKTDDGWVILTFTPGSATLFTVYVGESRAKTTAVLQCSIK